MNRVKQFFTSLPAHSFTIILAVLIAALMLNPSPTGEGFIELPLIWEATIHISLAGVFTIAILFDWQRKNWWSAVTWKKCTEAILISIFYTTFFKILQIFLPFFPVRNIEIMEISSQIAGALAFGLLYKVAQPLWSDRTYTLAGD